MSDDSKAVFDEVGEWEKALGGSNKIISILENTEKIIHEVIKLKIEQARKDLAPIAAQARLIKEEREQR